MMHRQAQGWKVTKWRWPSVFYPACYFLGLYRPGPPASGLPVRPRWSPHCLDFAASAAAASALEQPHFLESLGPPRPWPCLLGVLGVPCSAPWKSPQPSPLSLPTPGEPTAPRSSPGSVRKPKWSFWGSPTPSTGFGLEFTPSLSGPISTKSSASQSSQKERSRLVYFSRNNLATSHEFSS